MNTDQVIKRIEWRAFSIPFNNPFITAQGDAINCLGVLLFVFMDDGTFGLGEASPVGPGTQNEIKSIITAVNSVAPLMLGATIDEALNFLESNVAEDLPNPAMKPLRFGLETALYDALGKLCKIPLVKLLGGYPRRVDLNATISAGDADEVIREASIAVQGGFECVKVKVTGKDSEYDQAIIENLRRSLGADIKLRIDVNGALSLADALVQLPKWARFDLEYVEQPVSANEIEVLSSLLGSNTPRLAADESITGLEPARRILETKSASVIVIKLAAVGGLKNGQAIMRLAEEHACDAVVTSSIESGVGVSAAVHFASSCPENMPASGLATTMLLEHDLLSDSLPIFNASVQCPEKPGLGVSLDNSALDRYAIGMNGSIIG